MAVKSDWRIHLLILVLAQVLLFFYGLLIKGYNLAPFLLGLFVFFFPFLTKKYSLKIIYSLISLFSIPAIFVILFKTDVKNSIIFLLILISIGVINASINRVINYSYDEVICKKISEIKRAKIIKKTIIFASICLFIYTLLTLVSVDCITPDNSFFQDFKRCECEGISLPSFLFTKGACIGSCTNCICGFDGKEYVEYGCR